MSQPYHFRKSVEAAIGDVRKLLGASRNPAYPTDVAHAYADKYSLCEIGSRVALAHCRASLDVLTNGGFTKSHHAFTNWVNDDQVVTLAIQSEERCKFEKTQTRDVQSATVQVETVKGGIFGQRTKTSSSLTTITEHFWTFNVDWEVFAYAGSDPSISELKVVLCKDSSSCRIKTVSKEPHTPKPEFSVGVDERCSITHFVKALSSGLSEEGNNSVRFTINRADLDCHTPRRNKEVQTLLSQLGSVSSWGAQVKDYLSNIQPLGAIGRLGDTSDARKIPHPPTESYIMKIINPVAASFTFEDTTSIDDGLQKSSESKSENYVSSTAPASLTLGSADINILLTEFEKGAEKAALEMGICADNSCAAPNCKKGHIMVVSSFNGGPYKGGNWYCDLCNRSGHNDRWYCELCTADVCFDCSPKTGDAASIGEVGTVSFSCYTRSAARANLGGCLLITLQKSYHALVNAVESMLEEQVRDAIGKTVSPTEFAKYMDFHNERLFREGVKPRGFCHAIRRPGAYPEGVLSIEDASSGKPLPIKCISAHRISSKSEDSSILPVTFPLSAAADLTFYGDQYIHSFVKHKFHRHSASKLSLAARARQFSSFVLLVGKLSGPGAFEPESAIIVKDKDEVIIPLLLETIPTAKEFRDAIESLSPEQQAFCKKFRAMQLSSTLFAVAIIQTKPQLERVLNLPQGLLTKEIKLTQDLMSLFCEYQISPDLLAYDEHLDYRAEDSNIGSGETKSTASLGSAISAVKANVAEIKGFIQSEKNEELKDSIEETVVSSMSTGNMVDFSHIMRSSAPSAAPHMPPPMPRGGGGRGVLLDSMKKRKMRKHSSNTGGLKKATPTLEGNSRHTTEASSKEDGNAKSNANNNTNAAIGDEWISIPKRMDESFEKFNVGSSLRPTIIKAGHVWKLSSKKGLLSKSQVDRAFGENKQKMAKNRAFDLLDALTRSGAMPVTSGASMHIIMATTHCFDKSLMATLVEDNVNPIDLVERSSLVIASLVHGAPIQDLLVDGELERIRDLNPNLLK